MANAVKRRGYRCLLTGRDGVRSGRKGHSNRPLVGHPLDTVSCQRFWFTQKCIDGRTVDLSSRVGFERNSAINPRPHTSAWTTCYQEGGSSNGGGSFARQQVIAAKCWSMFREPPLPYLSVSTKVSRTGRRTCLIECKQRRATVPPLPKNLQRGSRQEVPAVLYAAHEAARSFSAARGFSGERTPCRGASCVDPTESWKNVTPRGNDNFGTA